MPLQNHWWELSLHSRALSTNIFLIYRYANETHAFVFYMGRFGFTFKGQFAAKSEIVSPAVSVGIRLHGK